MRCCIAICEDVSLCVVSVVTLCCVVLYPTDYLNVCVIIRRRKLTLLKRREGSLRRHCPQGMLFIRLCESTNPGCQKFSKRRAAKRREERREMWKIAFLSLSCLVSSRRKKTSGTRLESTRIKTWITFHISWLENKKMSGLSVLAAHRHWRAQPYPFIFLGIICFLIFFKHFGFPSTTCDRS